MANETFYPPITNLVVLDDLPDELGFVKDGLTDLLDNILYKDLQYSRTPAGDMAFYDLSIVSKKRIDVELPGTGIFLILNPSHDPLTNISEFPISLSYNWPIIAYVGSLDLSNFSFNPSDLFQLALKVFRLSEKTLIQRAIAVFLADVPNPISTFVSQLNSYYGTSIPEPTSGDPIGELVTSMKNEPAIGAVGVGVFALFILDNLDFSKSKENINKFFSDLVQPDFETFILDLLKPKIDASLRIGAALEFPRDVLLPVDNAGDPLPEPKKVRLVFNPAEFYFSTSKGIGYEVELGVTLNHKAQIGETGIGIELTNAKLDISRTTNIIEADQDGRPKEFVGAYIQEAAISLPNFLNHDDPASTARIVARNMIIGTGGFSGTLGLEAKSSGDPAPFIKANLGGLFEVSLDSFFISFKQNSVIGCNITGMLKIPGFKDTGGNDAEIKIKVDITDGGNYSITLSEDQGIGPFEIPNILRFSIISLSLGEKDNKFFVAISGKIDFIVNLPAVGDILPKGVEIKKLMIWEDGSLEFEGGTITLPKAISLKVGPVNFSVTAIHFGTHKQFLSGVERTYNYFGFDGGISVKPGGVDARGDGVKFYYTSDGDSPFDCFLRIDGIGFNLTIPGDATPETAAVIFKGYLAMKNADGSGNPTTEYVGAVSLALPKLNIAGSAAMRLNPDIPAFLVDIGLELSVPIMLGTTGLGIYGFRGLIGQKYMPSKAAAEIDESETWWYYYKSKKPNPPGTEGINFGKFQQKNGFSIGAGVSLATAPDVGKTFSSKIFFMLSLPEVFLLQGQAAILKDRIGLDDTVDPPFSVLIAITPQSIEAAFGVNYNIPDSGVILTLQATLELAFFFNNSNGWYINLGRDTPEEKRVQAKILTLFNGYAFLMLSASGIKAGAGVHWEFKKSYGPVRVELGSYLDMGGRISFKPVQIGGFIQIGGYAHASMFGFVLGFDISAGLAAECPKPFIVTGFFKLKFKLKLFWFLTLKFNINVELTWVFDANVNGNPLPVIGAATANYKPAVASNIMSREVFPVGYHSANNNVIPAPNSFPGNLPVVPMDSYIDVELLQAIKPGPDSTLERIGYSRSQIAEFYKVVVPPEKGKTDQVNHEFTVETIRVMHWDGAVWKEYFVYEAVSAINSIADLPNVTVKDHTSADLIVTDIKALSQGYWQIQKPNRYDKLRILSQNMFSYQTDGTPGGISLDGLEFSDEDVFCDPTLQDICVNWNVDEFTGAVYQPDFYYSFNGVYFVSAGGMSVQIVPNPHGFAQGLQFFENVEIYFWESVSKVTLQLITDSDRVIVHYCNWYWKIDEDGDVYQTYDIILSKMVFAADLSLPVVYDDINAPINKIIIETGPSTGIMNLAPVHIGSSTLKLTHFFNGELDQVRLFNKALTNADINSLYTTNLDLPSMVAGWSLDQTANDDTGNYNGQINGALGWTPGIFNDAALFLNNEYISVPHHAQLSFGETSFSISAWTKVSQSGMRRHMTVVEKMYRSNSGIFGYSLAIIDGYLMFDLAHFEVDQYNSGWVVKSDWHHIVIVVDRTRNLLKFYVDRELIRQYEIKQHPPKRGSTVLFELCYVDYEEALEYKNQIGNISTTVEVQDMENGLTKRFQPIWRPNTKYVVQIEAKDKVTHGASTLSNSSVFHNIGFQTSSTLGHFHKAHPSYTALLAQGKEEEYKLSKLQHYIDYDKSYPNADGKLVNAKPLFYKNVELLLFFRYAYIYSMFSDWDAYQGLSKVESALEVTIIDSEGDEIKQEPVWNFETQEGGYGEDIIKINKFVQNGKNCTGTQIMKPFSLQMFYKMPDLEPEKLYTAIFNSVYKASPASTQEQSEVHKYVFQTSRYASFEEQVKSYLAIAPEAVFEWEVDTNNTDVAKAITVLNNTISSTDGLVATYADPFDRLMQGALRLPALDVAVTTEFNIVKRKDNGKILGILVRNPEPFNDPKLPATQKQQTIIAKDAGANTVVSLVAKEPSKIFISNATMDLTAGSFEFKFTYYLFDGTDFAVKDQQTVNVTIS